MDSVLTVGRYSVDEWLASGTMGVVFRGYDPVLDRAVAIKLLRRELAKGSAAQGWRERFRQRARAAGRLFHPNITTILDFGEDHEIPFLAMEYVDGSRLDRLLKTAGRLAPQPAVAIILKLLDALKYSYENGVVHLDLKPSIVFVHPKNQVKVADFGLTLANASAPAKTGEFSDPTPAIAPEQFAGGPLDQRTDIFAAGAILFEMLTCAKPFRAGSPDEIIAQMAIRRPEDVCVLNPEVSSALRGVIETALAYDPDRRFATAGEFSRALSDAVSIAGGGENAMRPEARSPAHREGWDPETLRKTEAELATYIGPVAAIAVRRAAKQATDLVALYEELAVFIENTQEKAKFLESGVRLSTAASGGKAVSRSQDLPHETAPRASRPGDPPEPEVLDAIEAELAQYVGPIARILVKHQLQNFQNMPELYRSLANHISDEVERAAFLNSRKI